MLILKPEFFDSFKCTAGSCGDSCCVGWEIDIDPQTLSKYNSAGKPYYDEIRKKITTSADGSKCFELKENDRCPFLNKENLCDIIINCGQGDLCRICSEHPRFYNEYAGVTEMGLGLCCEEACRLLLECENFQIIEEDDGRECDLTADDEEEKQYYGKIFQFRKNLFRILENDLSLKELFCRIKAFAEEETEEYLFVKSDRELVADYAKTEPINKAWSQYIGDLQANLDGILQLENIISENKSLQRGYGKILSYMLFRHLSQAVFDGEIACRVAFCLESLRFVCLCDMKTYGEIGGIPLKERINNLKRWSQQVEYSAENTEFLTFGEIW